MKNPPIWQTVLIIILSLGILIYVHYNLFQYLGRFSEIEKSGDLTTAVIQETQTQGENLNVSYQYNVEDSIYMNTDIIASYEGVPEYANKQEIEVYYMAGDHSRSQIKTQSFSNTRLIIALLIDFLFVNGIAIYFIYFRSGKQN